MTRQAYARRLNAEQLQAGEHRRRAGGNWKRIGKLQLKFLRGEGLDPSSRLLDVGCGPLRAGRHFVRFLEPGHYYGIDINESLLEVGYESELPERLRAKLPRENLRASDRFECDFGVQFDFALAQSLFTHLPLNDIRYCLYRVAQHMKPGGRFYASFFEAPANFPLDAVLDEPDEWKPTRQGKFAWRNPYWYWSSDLAWAASFAPWEFRYLGDWCHPRGQKMAAFIRSG